MNIIIEICQTVLPCHLALALAEFHLSFIEVIEGVLDPPLLELSSSEFLLETELGKLKLLIEINLLHASMVKASLMNKSQPSTIHVYLYF